MKEQFDYTNFYREANQDITRNTSLVKYLNKKYFDIRGVVLGIDLENFVEGNGNLENRFAATLENIKNNLLGRGRKLIDSGIKAEEQYGIKIRTYRITTSPVPYLIKHFANGGEEVKIKEKFKGVALMLDGVAKELTDYCVKAYEEASHKDKSSLGFYRKGIEKDVYIAGFTSRVENPAI